MKKNFILLAFFFLVNCSTSNAIVESANPQFESMTFDAVTKNLIFEGVFPKNFINLSNQWFDNKVKINGFEGDMIFTLKNYSRKMLDINLKLEYNIHKRT